MSAEAFGIFAMPLIAVIYGPENGVGGGAGAMSTWTLRADLADDASDVVMRKIAQRLPDLRFWVVDAPTFLPQ